MHNAFLSTDEQLHSYFVKFATSVRNVVQHRPDGWRYFENLTISAVNLIFAARPAIPLDEFFQSVTFFITAVGLLGVDPDSLTPADIIFITTEISRLWNPSTRPHPIPPDAIDALNERLSRIVPDQQRFPSPLEVIFPAWETLWRLVAVGFIHAHDDIPIRRLFAAFFANPTIEQYRDLSPSVEHYMKETLRCHPPIRHITRAILRPPFIVSLLPRCLAERLEGLYTPFIALEAADVERGPMATDWGDYPDIFDPMRHVGQEVPPSLAFGCGEAACVARDWAPMGVAVIVASVLEKLQAKEYGLVRGEPVRGNVGWDGWRIVRK
jgi:hypothetical protein